MDAPKSFLPLRSAAFSIFNDTDDVSQQSNMRYIAWWILDLLCVWGYVIVIGGREKKHDFLTLKSPFFQIQQNFRILENPNLSSIQNLPFICSRFYEEAYKKELMTKLTYGYSR